MKHCVVMLALGCCALAAGAAKPDRDFIDVQVANGAVTVSEEEAHTNEGHGALVWRVATPGYAFTADGIVFDTKGSDKFKCKASPKGDKFRCDKLRHVKLDRYKYVVKLKTTGSAPAVPPLDPWIVND
jgi:hypothetical protein